MVSEAYQVKVLMRDDVTPKIIRRGEEWIAQAYPWIGIACLGRSKWNVGTEQRTSSARALVDDCHGLGQIPGDQVDRRADTVAERRIQRIGAQHESPRQHLQVAGVRDADCSDFECPFRLGQSSGGI